MDAFLPDGSQAVLAVADNGIGLAPEMLNGVFDVFRRVDRSGQNRVSSLGLGLPLVRRLAELNGGTVEARSEGLGKGAEFVVRLPLSGSAQAPDATPVGAGPQNIPCPCPCPCPCRKLNPNILLVQTAENWHWKNAPIGLNCA
jgi:hypothetical protein